MRSYQTNAGRNRQTDRQPLLQRRWQQQLLVGFVGKVGLAHQRIPATGLGPSYPNAPPIVFLGPAARVHGIREMPPNPSSHTRSPGRKALDGIPIATRLILLDTGRGLSSSTLTDDCGSSYNNSEGAEQANQ